MVWDYANDKMVDGVVPMTVGDPALDGGSFSTLPESLIKRQSHTMMHHNQNAWIMVSPYALAIQKKG